MTSLKTISRLIDDDDEIIDWHFVLRRCAQHRTITITMKFVSIRLRFDSPVYERHVSNSSIDLSIAFRNLPRTYVLMRIGNIYNVHESHASIVTAQRKRFEEMLL